eukprot:6847297-Karenia_brevis.AAC.1
MVAKPVSKKEILADTTGKAEAARQQEWNSLRKKGVWIDSEVRDWDKVAKEAKLKSEPVHFGYLHGLMVLRTSELPESDPNRKYKYRVVFLGDRVKTQTFE